MKRKTKKETLRKYFTNKELKVKKIVWIILLSAHGGRP